MAGTKSRPGGRRGTVGAVEPHGIHDLPTSGPGVDCPLASESRHNTGKGGYARKISLPIMTHMMGGAITVGLDSTAWGIYM